MKSIKKIILIIILFISVKTGINAQKPSLTVLNMDSQGLTYTPEQLGNLLRMEVEKTNEFEVTDRYDVKYLIKKNNLEIEDCYGKICLVEIGKLLKSDKMMSGSAEMYADRIIISLRLIDVKNEKIEKAQVKEFLKYPKQIQAMIKIVLYDLLDIELDEQMKIQANSLTSEQVYESELINPDKNKLNLSGPRLGLTYFTGEIQDVLTDEKYNGGFDASLPAMFMFGYQFEVQYLNSGNFQALFEFLPTVTGVDQGLFLPNVSMLMGFRHNLKGWEFALGPSAGLTKKARGYYENGQWHILSEWDYSRGDLPYPTEKRIDSRGYITYHTGFVIAAGKSFKSGRMNYPVNLFVIPSKSGMRFGLTFGFNAKNNQVNN